jgi:hypothetical protein
MRLGINLRGDLAKLDDTEIAAHYEALLAEKEAFIRSLPFYAKNKLIYRLESIWFGRGPLHARIFYRIQGFAIALFGLLEGGFLMTRQAYKTYLMQCEFKDVRDEMKRRIAARKAVAAT